MNTRNEAWSSGESEPEEDNITDRNFSCNDDLDDTACDEDQSDVHYDPYFYPSIKDFTGKAQIRDHVSIEKLTPLGCFKYFFDSFLVNHIVEQTNLYQEQNPEPFRKNMKPWVPINENELWIFMALSINMGHVVKGQLKDYWSKDPLLYTPLFSEKLSRNRYLQILRYLHFSDNNEVSNHPLKKIKPVIDHLKNKFSNTIIAGKRLCIDESLVLWKGRLKFKQFLPLKRNRFGIKLFKLVDCDTGFLLDFIVYTGSDTDYDKFDLGVSGDIVAHFMQPYCNEGRELFTDNWYTSPELAEFLHNKDTGLCGTVKKNRKRMPTLSSKLSRGEVEVGHNDTWMVIKWMDKKEVYVLSSIHTLEFRATGKKNYKTNEDIIKPSCIDDYNKNMGKVDDIDRQLSMTETIRKCMKWYRKLFFHLTDLMLSDAHSLYKMLASNAMSFPDFRLCIVREILKLDSEITSPLVSPDTRLKGPHFPSSIQEETIGKSIFRQCVLCNMLKERRRSKYECKICCKTLCIEICFEIYHTKISLP